MAAHRAATPASRVRARLYAATSGVTCGSVTAAALALLGLL